MGRDPARPERARLDLDAGHLAKRLPEGGDEPAAVPEPAPAEAAPRGIAKRHDPTPNRARQAAKKRDRLLLEVPGHEPLERAGVHEAEHGREDAGGDAVVRLSGGEAVREPDGDAGHLDLVRVQAYEVNHDRKRIERQQSPQ